MGVPKDIWLWVRSPRSSWIQSRPKQENQSLETRLNQEGKGPSCCQSRVREKTPNGETSLKGRELEDRGARQAWARAPETVDVTGSLFSWGPFPLLGDGSSVRGT